MGLGGGVERQPQLARQTEPRATAAHEIRIRVPFDPATLSLNARMHRMKRARLTKQARADAVWAWREAGSPRFHGPVDVEVVVYRRRVMDLDNIASGCKGVADGLFNGAVTQQDGPRWIKSYTVRQITGAVHVRPSVEFIVKAYINSHP
jgi:hypothetical protein